MKLKKAALSKDPEKRKKQLRHLHKMKRKHGGVLYKGETVLRGAHGASKVTPEEKKKLRQKAKTVGIMATGAGAGYMAGKSVERLAQRAASAGKHKGLLATLPLATALSGSLAAKLMVARDKQKKKVLGED